MNWAQVLGVSGPDLSDFQLATGQVSDEDAVVRRKRGRPDQPAALLMEHRALVLARPCRTKTVPLTIGSRRLASCGHAR